MPTTSTPHSSVPSSAEGAAGARGGRLAQRVHARGVSHVKLAGAARAEVKLEEATEELVPGGEAAPLGGGVRLGAVHRVDGLARVAEARDLHRAVDDGAGHVGRRRAVVREGALGPARDGAVEEDDVVERVVRLGLLLEHDLHRPEAEARSVDQLGQLEQLRVVRAREQAGALAAAVEEVAQARVQEGDAVLRIGPLSKLVDEAE
mmetsp:Transcript_31124/g.92753  ORF Transcript_31124/g.92753 Transcript_31124/m.92753 type:complete len:205 (-) Transcript_31124:36-650(-)